MMNPTMFRKILDADFSSKMENVNFRGHPRKRYTLENMVLYYEMGFIF